MGASFSNLQIFVDEKYSVKSKNEVASLLRDILKRQGYEEVNSKTESSRTIAISNVTNNRWISIYDEAMDYGTSEELRLFLLELSKMMTNPFALVSVFDSDILDISLLKDGKLIDVLNSTEEKIDGKQTMNLFGVDKENVKKLNDIWLAKDTFAEDILVNMAEILKWDKNHCLTGYNYLEDYEIENLLFLNFQKINTKELFDKNLGPTSFELKTYGTVVEGKAGEIKVYDVSLFNIGTESCGLSIGIHGEALEDKYVKVEKSVASVSIDYEVNGNIINTHTKDNRELVLAQFKDFKIPKGLKPLYKPIDPTEYIKMYEQRLKSSFRVKVYLRCLKECNSNIRFVYMPHSNQIKGQIGLKSPVKVSNS